MKDRFELFKSYVLGQKIEISDFTNSFQCFDLAYAYTMFLGVPKATIQHLYAYQIFTQSTPLTKQYFDLIPNTPNFVPQAGDIGVFDKTANNIAGHVCVCTGDGDKQIFWSIDANWAGQSKVTLIKHNYDNPNLLGVLRLKSQSLPEAQSMQKVDLSSLDNNTALKEYYGSLETDAIKAKFIAKDAKIKSLRDMISETVNFLNNAN